MMVIKLVVRGFTLDIISSYTAKVGLDEKVVRRIPHTEKLSIGGDFNVHKLQGAMTMCTEDFGDRNQKGASIWILQKLELEVAN